MEAITTLFQMVIGVVGGFLFLYFVGALCMHLDCGGDRKLFQQRMDACFARKPKQSSSALRLGLSIARKLLK